MGRRLRTSNLAVKKKTTLLYMYAIGPLWGEGVMGYDSGAIRARFRPLPLLWFEGVRHAWQSEEWGGPEIWEKTERALVPFGTAR